MSSFILFIHVLFGAVSLSGIGIAMLSKKGGRTHRRAGKTYILSMLFVLIAAVLLSLINSNLFLFLIAIFSGYLVYIGWRLAANRAVKFTITDKAVIGAMLLAAVCMLFVAIWMYLNGKNLATVIFVFGLIGGGFALADANKMRTSRLTAGKMPGWPTGRERIALHISRIGGACISTITAIFVVNIHTNPEFIAWLLPTVVIVPIIVYWVKRVRTVGIRPE